MRPHVGGDHRPLTQAHGLGGVLGGDQIFDELSEEQNDNMLDGILNNLPPSPLPKGPETKELDRVKEPPVHKRSWEWEER